MALREAGFNFAANKKQIETVIAWMPTIDNQPVASSPLNAKPPKSRTKLILTPWTVMGLPLFPEQAVEVLCACMGKQMLTPAVVVGSNLAFWATAMRFVATLVARQQFLPGMTNQA